MKVPALPVVVASMLLMLAQNTQSVIIKYDGLQVKLESVKKLDELLEQSGDSSSENNDHLLLCSNVHLLPRELGPVCERPDAADTFKALRTIAYDDCEICVNVACTGCN
ncbi:guanylate cyclase activator 2B [Notamacropus eugenii]|uniref:guanylate cyclase activator 2B n=1 Tax=Notamacropus eugenii TaxID=9315 RepID=UPI003B673227